MTDTAIHCFEKAGLGKAPFRCVGIASIPSASMAEHNPVAYNNAMAMLPRDLGCGTCNYCGIAIMHNCIILSADGRRFVVGSDCVARTGDAGLIQVVRKERAKVLREGREVKRRLKRADREAAWAQERAERAAAFRQEHVELLVKAEPYRVEGSFIQNVIQRGLSGGWVSERAIEAVANAIHNMEQRAFNKANSRHVGVIGARQTFKVTVERRASFERPSFRGFGYETTWIITMRDEAGNAIVSKSASFYAEKDAVLTFKATIKEHSEYDGEQQTVVQRIKLA